MSRHRKDPEKTPAVGLLTVLLVLNFASLGFGKTVSGVVVDPQGLVTVGPQVILTCGAHQEVGQTDSEGRFRFSRPSRLEKCTLSVSHPDFAPFKEPVARLLEPWLIQLQLREVNQVINVIEEEEESALTGLMTLTSVSLSAAELKIIGNNTPNLIQYAKALSGTTLSQDQIYVDGLPGSWLPPAEAIERITINTDPFSAEYAESDRNHIEITTRSPDRQLRFNLSGASLGLGGGSVLESDTTSTSRSTNLGLSGPIPRLPLTFSIHGSLGSAQKDQPIRAVTLHNELEPTPIPPARTTTSTDSLYLGAYYSGSEKTRANLSFYQSRGRSSNANVGGLTLEEAGMSSILTTRGVRAALEVAGAHHIYRSGLVMEKTASHAWAHQNKLEVVVLGSFVGGGASVLDKRTQHTSWTWKNVLDSITAGRSWSVGTTLSGSQNSDFELPAVTGRMQFETLEEYAAAQDGASTGTWYLARGQATASYNSTMAATFLQSDLLRSRTAILRGGVRLDYQNGGGVQFSPRLFGALKVDEFTFRGGAGRFVHNWTNDVFMKVRKGDGQDLQRFVISNASFEDVSREIANDEPTIVSSVAPNLVRPHYLMLRASVDRRFRKLFAGVEYTWTKGLHLLGSRRMSTPTGWLDRVESNRLLRKHQLHTRLSHEWKNQTIVFHYEWIRSHDDTDGPFSFPENQDDIGAEWARTTGVAAHNFSLVANWKLPSAVSLSLVVTSRSPIPLNITSPLDVNRDSLYNDREGQIRNSGVGPAYHWLTLFVHHRLKLPHFMVPSSAEIYADLGLHADNLLNNKNYLTFGSVMNSPLFEQPLRAFHGRSLRLSINLAL